MIEFDNENLNIHSQEVKDILSTPPKSILRWGNSMLFLFITLIIILSWMIKYPDIVVGEGIVTTIIPPQKEFAKITGKFDSIFVKDNQKVTINTPIAIIENTVNYKDVFFLKSILDTIVLNKKHFYFPIEKTPILFLGDIETSYINFENNYIQYVLNKELLPFSNEAIANKSTIFQLKKRLGNSEFQKKINKTELSFKKKDLNRSKILFEKGVISEKNYETKQLEYLKSERDFQNINSSISLLRESIINNKVKGKGANILRIREEMMLLKNTIQSFNQLKKSIKDWESKYAFISKINGNVSFLNYWSKNQTVFEKDLVFTIIPNESSSFIAKLKIPPENLGKVKIGQKVNIRLRNYPSNEFGVLQGRIKNISEILNKDGFYIIDVYLAKKLIMTYNKEIYFRQEMLGTAEIITEDLRLINRFFYQFKKILDRT